MPGFAKPRSGARPLQHAGFTLYNSINFVVFLTENMRARGDPLYTQILSDLRWGQISDEQLAILNSRCQPCVQPVHDEVSNQNYYRPVVVATNKLRCAINRNMLFHAARTMDQPVFECIAEPTSRSRHIFKHIVDANDDLTGRVPMKLQFVMGMPIMMTHKHPDLMSTGVIANGTMGVLLGTVPPIENYQFVAERVHGILVKRFVQQPRILLVRLRNCTKTLVNGFSPGVIGIPPIRTSVKLNRIPNLSQASITVQQFALVPAFACTTEKLQGQTCKDGVILPPLERQSGMPSQTLYVALSRATDLRSVTLTKPITREYLARFSPSKTIIDETQRLIQLVRFPPYISNQQRQEFQVWRNHQQSHLQ